MDGRSFPRRISRFNDCARAAFGTGGGPDGYRVYSAAGLVFSVLYQLLKYEYAAGSYTVIGAMIIPGLAFGSLLLAPFLDRGLKEVWKRPVAVGMMLLALCATVFNVAVSRDA